MKTSVENFCGTLNSFSAAIVKNNLMGQPLGYFYVGQKT
jgi:hypothetical protein